MYEKFKTGQSPQLMLKVDAFTTKTLEPEGQTRVEFDDRNRAELVPPAFHSPGMSLTSTRSPMFTCFKMHETKSNNIDFLKIDIEGHELVVLSSFDFSKWNIKLMTVEHNLYCNGSDMKDKLFSLLSNNGFTRVVEDAICLDRHPSVYGKPFEDWF